MTTYADVAEFHVPNRLVLAAEQKTPLNEIHKIVPVRCLWCRRRRKSSDVYVGPQLQLLCIDSKSCNEAHKRLTGRKESRIEDVLRASNAVEAPKERKSEKKPQKGKQSRCREMYDGDRSERCLGPEGHAQRYHRSKNHKWKVEE